MGRLVQAAGSRGTISIVRILNVRFLGDVTGGRSLLALLQCLLAGLLFLCSAANLAAQGNNQAATTPLTVIEHKSTELEAISRLLSEAVDQSDFRDLALQAIQIQTQTEKAVEALDAELASVDAQLGQLGETAENEAGDIREVREQLQSRRTELDSGIKRGRLLVTSAAAAVQEANDRLSAEFSRNTFEKASSPVSLHFWREVWQSLRADVSRMSYWMVLGHATRPDLTSVPILGASCLTGYLLVGRARKRLNSLGLAYATSHLPATRIRRSGVAVWMTAVGTFLSFLAIWLVLQASRYSGIVTDGFMANHAPEILGAGSFVAFIISLGNALLMKGRESWRLLPLDDEDSRALHQYPVVCACLLILGMTVLNLTHGVGMGGGTVAFLKLITSIGYSILMASFWRSLGLIKARSRRDEKAESREEIWTSVAMAICRVVIASTIVAALAGYLNLAILVGSEIIWIAVIAAATYLLTSFVDDASLSLCAPDGRLALHMQNAFDLRPSIVRQIGVLTSAILRIAIVFLAIVLALSPLGASTGKLFAGIETLSTLTIAGITIDAGSIMRAAVVLILATAMIRLIVQWLEERYLPVTELDSGARNSAVTITRYAGFMLAGLLAVNTLGVGVERIALVVSALSVGIGFGLQAITQNFVSGLILLTERPLKVGDTIRIGTDEGDVQKISVRATEIQISDRSRLIVPNSELITKTIRNMTPAGETGRLDISFAVSIGIDPVKVEQLLRTLFAEHEAILTEPAPSILICGISDGKIHFETGAFVSSPRLVKQVRSSFLFMMLKRFQEADIPLDTA